MAGIGRNSYKRAMNKLKTDREPKKKQIKGLMGIFQGGEEVIEVPGREGFVWVRLRNSYNEVIQAYNSDVALVYGLPILVERDPTNPTRYRVVGRDVGRYSAWGTTSAYLGRHGSTHTFGLGNDITFVETNQIMYFMIQPSGTAGSMSVYMNDGVYYYSNAFRHAGNTGSATLDSWKPTNNQARMILCYLDKPSGNFFFTGGSTFDATLTATSAIMPYIPAVPANGVPLAGIRLVSGTISILWQNIYDLRQFLNFS